MIDPVLLACIVGCIAFIWAVVDDYRLGRAHQRKVEELRRKAEELVSPDLAFLRTPMPDPDAPFGDPARLKLIVDGLPEPQREFTTQLIQAYWVGSITTSQFIERAEVLPERERAYREAEESLYEVEARGMSASLARERAYREARPPWNHSPFSRPDMTIGV